MKDEKQRQASDRKYPLTYGRAGIEFVSGIFAGFLAGYAFDHFFKTSPWGLIGLIFLGSGVGFWNVFRIVQEDKS